MRSPSIELYMNTQNIRSNIESKEARIKACYLIYQQTLNELTPSPKTERNRRILAAKEDAIEGAIEEYLGQIVVAFKLISALKNRPP